MSVSLLSEPSAVSSAVFRPGRDVASLLPTDLALWSKALLKAMGLSSSAVYTNLGKFTFQITVVFLIQIVLHLLWVKSTHR